MINHVVSEDYVIACNFVISHRLIRTGHADGTYYNRLNAIVVVVSAYRRLLNHL